MERDGGRGMEGEGGRERDGRRGMEGEGGREIKKKKIGQLTAVIA